MTDGDGPRNPFEGITDFFSELGRLREVGTHGGEHRHEERQRTHASAWVPTTDIFAEGADLVIRVELAGVSPDDVELTYSHGMLTVAGTRKSELRDEAETVFYVRERFYGEFRRTFTLPEGTDERQIGAEFYDGLVEITVRDCAKHPDVTRIEVRNRSGGPTSRSLG
jgi:HSP20 family protein